MNTKMTKVAMRAAVLAIGTLLSGCMAGTADGDGAVDEAVITPADALSQASLATSPIAPADDMGESTDQKASQLYNLLSQVVKAQRECNGTLACSRSAL